MRNFKNYIVWQRAHELVTRIYQDISLRFPKNEEYGLTSQMRRSAYSIPLNIAEGCGRKSDKDFAHFLDLSLGSAHELEYCILLIKDLDFLNVEQFKLLNRKVNAIKAMLINLIKSIRVSKKNA